MTSKLVVNTIEADTGISSVSFASSISMSSTSKFFFGAAGIDIGADTNINRPEAGVLGFNINSTERLRIDSNGNLKQSGSGNVFHYINTGNNSGDNSQIAFGDSADADAGYINYDHGTNALQIRTNGGSNSLVINSSGNVGVATDNPTNKLSVCNGGIKVFGAATPNINFSPVHGNSGNADVSFDGNDLKIISNSSSAKVIIGAYSKLTHFVIKANGRIGIGTDDPSNSSLLHLYSTTFDPYLRVGGGTRDCGITLQPNNAFNALRSDSANRLWVNAGADSIRFTVGGDSNSYEKLRIESWGGIHNNQSAIYGGGVANEPKVHFNGAAPSNDAARGHLAVSDSANYNASPIARISLVTRYNSAGGYTYMGGIEGGKENSTDGQYGGFVRIVTRPHGSANLERLRISSTGHVTKPASCAFNVTHNGSQNYTSAGTHTITTWKTTQANRGFENTTTGGYFSNGIFTAPVTGAYFFTSTILLKDINGTNDVHLIWSKNNTTYTYWETRFHQNATGYGYYEAVSGQCTMYMNAGDTCRIKITFSGSGCGVYGSDPNWGNWGGFLIG